MSTDYRVVCSKATDNTNRAPWNRMSKAAAEKKRAEFDREGCPGQHTVEEIKETSATKITTQITDA